MILNPKLILEKGILTLPINVDVDKVLQPNGIDLSVLSVSRIMNGMLIVGDDVNTSHIPCSPLPLESILSLKTDEGFTKGYFLQKNHNYKIETGYELHLPEDVVAYIFTRSSLNRNGILVGSGLWDSGYHGPIGTTLYPFQDFVLVPPGRIAQIVFMKAESSKLYQGSYNQAEMKRF